MTTTETKPIILEFDIPISGNNIELILKVNPNAKVIIQKATYKGVGIGNLLDAAAMDFITEAAYNNIRSSEEYIEYMEEKIAFVYNTKRNIVNFLNRYQHGNV